MRKFVYLGLLLPLSLFSTCNPPDPSTTEGLWWLLHHERFDAFSINLGTYNGDINSTDQYGQTFLTYMSYFPEPDIIKKLIEKGADVNKTSRSGNSPLRATCSYDNAEVAKILIQAGAEIDILDEDKETPLHIASVKKSHNVMLLLLENGANPNVINEHGWSPLQRMLMSSQKPSVEMVELLLKHGADPSYRNPDPVFADSSVFGRPEYPTGFTALEIAEDGGYEDIIALLKKYGATE